MASRSKSLCPSLFCAAHDPMQVLVSAGQAEAVGEPALEGAILCSSCGCVWVRDQAGKPHVLGTLRRAGRGYEWRSAYKVSEAGARSPDGKRE